jgi:hypothetical protein
MGIPGNEYKLAKDLKREDFIMTYDYSSRQVIVEKIRSILIEPVEGFAAPLTLSGSLLVNGMLTSSYALVDSQAAAHAVMTPVRWWYRLTSGYPVIGNRLGLRITKQDNGTHWFPQLLHTLSNQYLKRIVKLY